MYDHMENDLEESVEILFIDPEIVRQKRKEGWNALVAPYIEGVDYSLYEQFNITLNDAKGNAIGLKYMANDRGADEPYPPFKITLQPDTLMLINRQYYRVLRPWEVTVKSVNYRSFSVVVTGENNFLVAGAAIPNKYLAEALGSCKKHAE